MLKHEYRISWISDCVDTEVDYFDKWKYSVVGSLPDIAEITDIMVKVYGEKFLAEIRDCEDQLVTPLEFEFMRRGLK